jgi:hypothetical protein
MICPTLQVPLNGPGGLKSSSMSFLRPLSRSLLIEGVAPSLLEKDGLRWQDQPWLLGKSQGQDGLTQSRPTKLGLLQVVRLPEGSRL